jgi:hypothetical protein
MKVSRIAGAVALVLLVAALAYGLRRNSVIIDKYPRYEMDMRTISVAIEGYKIEFGEYPNGGNLFTTKALTGENPKRIVFLQVSLSGTNMEGELIDPWGTPYQILASEKVGINVRSAGPNRRFDDDPKSDDIVRAGR